MAGRQPILAGLRVVDAGTYIAAPAAATMLSDFGAEVIKVERPPLGDPYRYLSLVPGMPVSDQLYCWILDSRNKKSIALDLNDAAGREVLGKLVVTADVFVTNYQPQLVRKFRLGYEELSALNPRLIYALVTGYGEEGPEAENPGYDATAYWARSGLMGMMHNGDAEPCRSPAGFGDHPTAVTLFAAILLGLYQRERTGEGSKVSTSLMANGVWSNSCQIQAMFCHAQVPEPITRKKTDNPLVNHYLASDGHRFLLCGLDPKKDWAHLCESIGRTDLIDDRRFNSPARRTANSVELVTLLDAAFARATMAEWKRRFAECEVIWGPVPKLEEVAGDEQMERNGVFAEIEKAPGGKLKTVTNPITVQGEEKVPPRMAPAAGEHTVEILHALGYEEGEIAELLRRGVAMAAGPRGS